MTNPQIGFESEIARIVIDTGVIGLGTWIFFLFWAAFHGDHSESSPFMRAFLGPLLLTGVFAAMIGVGTLAIVTALLLLFVGIRCASAPAERQELVFKRVAMSRAAAGSPTTPNGAPAVAAREGASTRARTA